LAIAWEMALTMIFGVQSCRPQIRSGRETPGETTHPGALAVGSGPLVTIGSSGGAHTGTHSQTSATNSDESSSPASSSSTTPQTSPPAGDVPAGDKAFPSIEPVSA